MFRVITLLSVVVCVYSVPVPAPGLHINLGSPVVPVVAAPAPVLLHTSPVVVHHSAPVVVHHSAPVVVHHSAPVLVHHSSPSVVLHHASVPKVKTTYKVKHYHHG